VDECSATTAATISLSSVSATVGFGVVGTGRIASWFPKVCI
jgi:hypothetical protein